MNKKSIKFVSFLLILFLFSYGISPVLAQQRVGQPEEQKLSMPVHDSSSIDMNLTENSGWGNWILGVADKGLEFTKSYVPSRVILIADCITRNIGAATNYIRWTFSGASGQGALQTEESLKQELYIEVANVNRDSSVEPIQLWKRPLVPKAERGPRLPYSRYVLKRMKEDRGLYHNFSDALDSAILSNEPSVTRIDGRKEYLQPGLIGCQEGVYHITVKRGEIIHRFFVPRKKWNKYSDKYKLPRLDKGIYTLLKYTRKM